MEFLEVQEPWSRLPFPSPGDLTDPGIEPWSLGMQADSLWLNHQEVLHPAEANGGKQGPALSVVLKPFRWTYPWC